MLFFCLINQATIPEDTWGVEISTTQKHQKHI